MAIRNKQWSGRSIINIGQDVPDYNYGYVTITGSNIVWSGAGRVGYIYDYEPGNMEGKMLTDGLLIHTVVNNSNMDVISRYTDEFKVNIIIQYYDEGLVNEELTYVEGSKDNINIYPYYRYEDNHTFDVEIPTRDKYVKRLEIQLIYKGEENEIRLSSFNVYNTVTFEKAIEETFVDSDINYSDMIAKRIEDINEYDNGFEVYYENEEMPATVEISQIDANTYKFNISDIYQINYNVKSGNVPK